MSITENNSFISRDRLLKIAMILWITILFLVGTNLRVRSGTQAPEMDWLVLVQIAVCLIGGFIGVLLIRQNANIGWGAKTLLIYLLVAGISAFFSPDMKTVFGYWFLLSGASLLTLGIVQTAQNKDDLCKIENVWLFIIIVILIKDSITALFFPTIFLPEVNTLGVYRIGMGVTHANVMSLFAAIAFWVSYKKNFSGSKILIWILRSLFLFIIILSRTRVSMACFIIGGIIWILYKKRTKKESKLDMQIAFICLISIVLILGIIALSFDVSWATTGFTAFNRFQDTETILSLSGRVDIWSTALRRTFASPYSLIFGHGYGITRLLINEGPGAPPFFAYHTHNSFIEVLFSTGLLGFFPIVLFVIYGTMWITKYRDLRMEYSNDFAMRAIIVVSIILINSLTEAHLGAKTSPVYILFIFYVLALDKRQYL